MPEHLDLGEGSWEDLLDFLDPDRGQKRGVDRDVEAETRYREITRKLVCFFAGRGCQDADDLAMTTMLRVAARCGRVETAAYGDRIGYFYGVARNVLHEAHRDACRDRRRAERLKQEPIGAVTPDPDTWRGEASSRCLDRCMAKLTVRARLLLTSYYRGEGWQKVEAHRSLAGEFGKSLNALRIELHRVRKTLRQCVFACLQLASDDMEPPHRPVHGTGA